MRKNKYPKYLNSSSAASLMYAIMCTRPNIYYVVRLVSRFQSNLGQKSKALDGNEENIEISERNIRFCSMLPRQGFALSWMYKC